MPRPILRFTLKLLSILFITQNQPVFAQTVSFSSVALPSDLTGWVADIKQDRQGYLWMATMPGLHRYNGSQWTTFLHDDKNPASLADNLIESICPTRDGFVWVGSQGLGLDCLNPETGHVSHHLLAGRHERNETENVIAVMREGRDGTLWIGTHGGLYSRDPKTGRFTRYTHNPRDPNSLSHNQVRAIYEDRQGTIWVGTGEPSKTTPQEGGLNRLDRRTGRFTRYRHDPKNSNSLIDNRVRAIFEDSRGTFWVGTWGDGLHTMDRRTGQFTRYPYDPAHPERLSRPYLKAHQGEAVYGISFIEEDQTGGIWIGAYAGGLNRYDPKTKQIVHYEYGESSAASVISNNQWSVCRSPDGVLWFGAAGVKLTKAIISPKPIPFITNPPTINAFFEYAPGKFWFGTNLGLKDSELGKVKPQPFLEQAARQTTLLTDRITDFYEDRQKNYWLGTWTLGLYNYDPRKGQFTHFSHDPAQPASLSPGPVLPPYEDRSGTLWVTTGGGLDRLDRQTRAFTHYRHNPADSTTISDNFCIAALEDHRGQFWVGTYNYGGINRMNRQTGTFTRYLKGTSIMQLLEDKAGRLWAVAALGNLFQHDRKQNQFRPFLEPGSGIPLTGVKSLIEDDTRNLWVGTTKGLIKINRQRNSISVFGADYGFLGAESVYYFATLKSHDGSLLFGGATGYYHFRPNELAATRSALPPVVLSALRITNQPVGPDPDGPLRGSLATAKTVYLAHGQNTLSFDFTVLDYRHPEQTQYTFFLENYEPSWRPIGPDRTANYYNIPPGKYVFRVKAGSLEQGWSEKSIAVVISAPWWQTWWAYGLFALLLGGGVWGFIQYRSRALRQENRLLEDKVALRTEQLQQSLDDLKSTQTQLVQKEKMASLGELTAGIAHEIQNPLNFVNNFSEVSAELVAELEGEQQKPDRDTTMEAEILGDLKQNLQKITHHGNRASAIVRGMLEHARTSTSEKRVTDLNPLADECLKIAYQGWRSKDKTFTCELVTDFDGELTPIEVMPQEIGRVLLNLFNNAFYAVRQQQDNLRNDASYIPTVWVSTKLVLASVEIRVRDNGTGIPESMKAKIFQPFFTTKPTGEGTGLGLSLSYDIVTKGHGGALTVETETGQFTEFTVILPPA